MITILAHLAAIGPEWIWHPLGQCTAASSNPHIAAHEIIRCRSYNFWSGIGSDIGEITILGALVVAYRKIECHQSGCHRIGRFEHGHFKLCRIHHPHVPATGKIGRSHIDEMTKRKGDEP